MASLKDEREESDGEEMDHESGDSDKSSTTSDSSDGTDSEDSSELDIEECERRRNECIEILGDMERQFVVLREHDTCNRGKFRGQLCVSRLSAPRRKNGLIRVPSFQDVPKKRLYRERITQINKKLEEVHEGVAKEYCQPLEELKENMRVRIEVAGILKKLRLENIENSFKAEEQAARQNFENEKLLLFDAMKEELEEKIRRLEEDRNSIDFHSDSFYHSSEKSKNHTSSGKGKGSWRKGLKSESGRRKPVTVTGPYIVYMLSEAEILEDWTLIKKALQSSKRNNSNERKPFHRFL